MPDLMFGVNAKLENELQDIRWIAPSQAIADLADWKVIIQNVITAARMRDDVVCLPTRTRLASTDVAGTTGLLEYLRFQAS